MERPAKGPGRTVEPFVRSVHRYAEPRATLVDQDGRRAPLAEVLAPGAPLAVNFVFTRCTTVCLVMTAAFAGARRRRAALGNPLRLVSITVDPEHDGPEVLRAHAIRLHAGSDWRFLTGRASDLRLVLAALDGPDGGTAGHRPVALLRGPRGGEWIRLEGLPGATDLVRELRKLEGYP